MNKSCLVSVIVSSYNWSGALEAVLNGLSQQIDTNFEVILADDGSSPEELAKINALVSSCEFPVRLVHQEDNGFRVSRIRNLAALESRGEYLVFLDGDCIPRPDFIKRHRILAERGFWLAGNRVLFSQRYTATVLKKHGILRHTLGYWAILRWRGCINRWLSICHWPFSLGRKLNKTAWKGAKTCNLSVWRDDFMRVNGFDERYEGWGYEDSDFVIRLIRAGVFRKSGKFALAVFHLWHPTQDRSQQPENLARLQSIISNQETLAALGVNQHATQSIEKEIDA